MCIRVAKGSFRNLDRSRLTLFLLLVMLDILDVALETLHRPDSFRVDFDSATSPIALKTLNPQTHALCSIVQRSCFAKHTIHIGSNRK